MNKTTNAVIEGKPNCVINVPISHGELTLVTSDDAQETLRHSARFTNLTRQCGLNVLVINCGMSDKRFRSHYYKEIGEESMHSDTHKVILYSSECGELVAESESINQVIEEAGIGAVVLCGWEFAASSHRKKQKLMFYLRSIMKYQNVAIIVYGHNSNHPSAGKIDKGGVGMLSLLASEVVKIEAAEMLETVIEKPIPQARINSETHDIEKNVAQLFRRKINELDTHGAPFTERDLIDAMLEELKGEPYEITEQKYDENECNVIEATPYRSAAEMVKVRNGMAA